MHRAHSSAGARAGGPPLGGLLTAFATLSGAWGGTYLAIRIGIETIPPLLLVGTRYFLAGGALYVWSRLRGEPRPTLANWRTATVAGALMLLGGNGALAWAEQRVPSGLAALLLAITPLCMVLLEWWKKNSRPNGVVAAGVVLGFLGIAVLVGPGPFAGRSSVDPVGAVVLVLAALSWATGALYARDADLPRSVVESTGLQMFTGGILMVLFGILRGEPAQFSLATVSLRSWLAFGYLIVFGGIIGFTAFSWLMRVTSPARVSTYAYVNPVVAVLLGWGFGGEPLGGRTLLAGAIIVAGVVLVITFRGRTVRAIGRTHTSPALDAAGRGGVATPQESDGAPPPVPVGCDADA